ncbi:MAG: C40 family peptidase [Bacteroidales bacterium]|jgi:hypothetical protein|nr:C40 family peptidase [Bacteroidales bacterium]
MKYAINLHPVIPVRRHASETSEMTTQLLFGELFVVKSNTGKWVEIKNVADGYSGWISANMATFLLPATFFQLVESPVFPLHSLVVQVKKEPSGQLLTLPCGSLIRNFCHAKNSFSIAGRDFSFIGTLDNYSLEQNAERWLNAPYLWGGKTVFGVDCSGFVQLIFSLSGIQLPRDAKEQSQYGVRVSFGNTQTGDLAFFCNENSQVVHVGIIINNQKVIHASGKVRIDYLTADGILSSDTNQLTHRLFSINRI